MKRIGDIFSRNKTPVVIEDGLPSTNGAPHANINASRFRAPTVRPMPAQGNALGKNVHTTH